AVRPSPSVILHSVVGFRSRLSRVERNHGSERIRSGRYRQRAGWAEGRDMRGQASQEGGHHRPQAHDRRRVRAHRDDSSKTLREAVLYLSGFRQRTFYGRGYVLKDRISMSDLIFRAQGVMTREIEVIKSQLRRNYINVVEGDARFLDPHTIAVMNDEGAQVLKAHHVLIACGTRPAHSQDIP